MNTQHTARMEPSNHIDDSILAVNECVEHLQKLLKLKSGSNLTSYIGSIKTLHHILVSKDESIKHFTSPSVGGIPLLVSILEHVQDMHVKQTVVMIIKAILSKKADKGEKILALATCGATNPLLKLIVKMHQPFNYPDDFVASLFTVVAKIGKKDRKFATKARLLGVLPVIATNIRFYALRPKVLNSLLMLLKRILISVVNSNHLSKADLIEQLLFFLDPSKRKMTISIMYTLEALSLATKSRYTTRQLVKLEVTEQLLQVLSNSFDTSSRVKACRISRAYNAVLIILFNMTILKSGRESLCAASAVTVITNWLRTIATNPGSHVDKMVYRASVIVQRCLPPRSMPLSKLNSPLVFTLPDHRLNEELDLSGDSRLEVCDSDSPISSNSSCFESEGDSDQGCSLFLDQNGVCPGDSVRQCLPLFDELKEEKQPRTSQFSSTSLYFEETVEVEEPLVFISHEPEPFSNPHLPTNHDDPKQMPAVSMSPKVKSQKIEKPVEEKVITRISPETNTTKLCFSPSKNAAVSKRSDKKNVFTSSEVRQLMDSAKEESRAQKYLENVDSAKLYQSFAAKTASVLPFVKIAYPDSKCCLSYQEALIKFCSSRPNLIRNRTINHIEEMANRQTMHKEVYNLDSFLCESDIPSSELKNMDENRVSESIFGDHLQFESRFESGNLRKVYWKGGREYDLILSPDVNSKSHHQWFYFEVSGTESNSPYVFNVINMEKSSSLFNIGMCPVMFSVKAHMERKQGWVRNGTDICYYRNHYIQGASATSSIRDKPYFTLTFTITFPYDNDVCYLAYHYPYTYTALQTHVECWLNSYDTASIYCKKDELCKTLAGNSVPLLTITAKPKEGRREYIFLTARVHPGESNASWAMKGTLDFLFSNKPSAIRLREMFIFKIVPMLNPDGVINGCHRCSLSGQDLNRQWITPNPKLHPTIYYTKALLYYLNTCQKRKPLIFCDYHGHSRRHNVFLYGCNPEQSWWPGDESKFDCESYKIIPLLMHQMVPTFNLEHCCFNIERSRESTARVTVWRQFDVPMCYTMECTYGGCDQGLHAGYHIGITQLEETGAKLCQCFGKLSLNFDDGDFVACTIPIDTSMLSKVKNVKLLEVDHMDSFSSSLSEEDIVEYEECDQQKGQ